jgi:predicted RNA-binding protein with PUA-like domain
VNYWLMKSEPSTFSIDALATAPRRTTCWEGVRNYQARNLMRDRMHRGDLAFFYHSSCAEPGIVGIVRIARGAYPDPSAFDRSSPYFDPLSRLEAPRWLAVDVRLLRRFARPAGLKLLRQHATRALRDLWLLRRGNRLSIMPVSAAHWRFILGLIGEPPARG